MSQLKTASVLAFERKLDISDAFFSQINSVHKDDSKQEPVVINEKSVRGTISNRLKNAVTKDPVNLDAKIEVPNLKRVDAAALDEECDTLVVNWSCKVLPFTGQPSVCNNQEYQKVLVKIVQDYLHQHGVSELAKRYATNIVNARWLWRNRVGAESISVTVECNIDDKNHILEFDSKSIGLNDFNSESQGLNTLSSWLEQGLKGQRFVILYITSKVKMGFGQEVFPSQELVLDTGKTKSKELYQINGKAGLHSQKVGNAIRTIDNWYPDAEFPIAVEPYGAVTTLGTAFRQPKQEMDFYSLFDKWVLTGEKPAVEQQHYVMAVLIRGGVFGASGNE